MKQHLSAVLLASLGLVLSIVLFIVHLSPVDPSGLPGWLAEWFASCRESDQLPPPILGQTLYGWYISGMAIQLFLLLTGSRMKVLSRPGLGTVLILVPTLLVILTGLDVWVRQRMNMPICTGDWIMRLCAVVLMGWTIRQHSPVIQTFRQSLGQIGRWILGKEPTAGGEEKTVGLILLAALFLAVAVTQRQTIAQFHWGGPDPSGASVGSVLSDHLAKPEVQFSISEDDLTLGPSDAPVRMVVFSDFECPYCAELSRSVTRWHRQYGDRLQITFKHYPLSTACNPHLQDDLHPLACQAALFSQAVSRQGGFWAYHDSLFAGDLSQIDLIGAAIAQGLDPVQLATDLQDPAVHDKLERDIEEAVAGEVMETPTVFVNGRKAVTANPDYLDQLLAEMVSQADDQ